MSIIEDKGLDSTIAYGLYGCKEDNEKIFINCYDQADLDKGLRFSKAIDKLSNSQSIGLEHNPLTFERLSPYLMGVHRCNESRDVLYITSNEWDLLTIAEIEPLKYNIVAVINRLDDYRAISSCYEFIHQFKKVVLIPTKSKRCSNWAYEVKKRIETEQLNVQIIELDKLQQFNSINDLYAHNKDSIETIKQILKNTVDIMPPNVTDISKVDCIYTNQLRKIYSMFDYVDAKTGGMILGDVWLLTGRTGAGKTELSIQLSLAAIQQEHKVFVYSGEIPKERYISNLLGKIVGSKYIKKVPRKLYGGREAKTEYDSWIEPHIEAKAKEWLKNKYYIYDSTTMPKINEYEYLLHVMEMAHKENGCTMFVVDNLMSLMCSASGNNLLQQQSDFTNKLVAFAKKYNVHVQLVAHPRKTIGDEIKNDDVAGSSNITNLAHVVISVHKTTDEEKREDEEKGRDPRDSIIKCSKNRTTGETFKYPLFFNKDSKTFTPVKGQEFTYDWDSAVQQEIKLTQEEIDELPF